jgi:hypothetical protein
VSAPTPAPPRGVRAIVTVLALGAWFGTQALIGARGFPAAGMGDAVHEWTAPLHGWLLEHPRAGNALLIVSSAFIDAFGVFLLGAGIFGRSIRPLVGLLMLFGLRQLCQMLCAFPPPDNMIWHSPGFPSLLVTYGVSNDLFFSGHTAIAVFGATELARIRPRWAWLAVAVAVFEATTVLVLRAHYTADVFTGAVAALLIAIVAARIAPALDARLARPAAAAGIAVAPQSL